MKQVFTSSYNTRMYRITIRYRIFNLRVLQCKIEVCNSLPPKCSGTNLYRGFNGAEINTWATRPSALTSHGYPDTASGLREGSYCWLQEARRDIFCFTVCPEASI